jgi:hypothetical protein
VGWYGANSANRHCSRIARNRDIHAIAVPSMKDPDDLMPEWMVSPAYPPGPIAFERIAINQGALCIEHR